VIAFLRRYPLALFLPLQALLGFFHLGLFSPWMDEAGTLLTEHNSLSDVIRFASHDVHPPLFYLLLFAWQRLPLGLDWAVQARVLSIIFGLLATVALDRLWTSGLPERVRLSFLALWSLSPCLLLYTRMSRSYGLQVFLVVIAAAYLLRMVDVPGWRNGGILASALLATLYTHYAPGLALLGAAHVFLGLRRRWLPLAALDAAVAVGYAPWIWRLAASLGSWGNHAPGYSLTGRPWLEFPVKLAYWAVSFTMGEAVPDPLLILGLVVLAAALWLVWAGAHQYPRTATLAGMLAVAGFVGVARWVSYPFVPARLLFLLPFFLLLLAAGAGVHRRAGNVVLGAMLLLSLSGDWCYFQRASFRNKQYPMPMREIAAQIRENSSADSSVILVDSANSDPTALEYALGPGHPFLQTTFPDTGRKLASRMADRRVRTVWFLRNTHDVTPGALNTRFEEQVGAALTPTTTYYYQPYSLLERALMSALGTPEPPWYFHELLLFRR
jgi:hypothetical protein